MACWTIPRLVRCFSPFKCRLFVVGLHITKFDFRRVDRTVWKLEIMEEPSMASWKNWPISLQVPQYTLYTVIRSQTWREKFALNVSFELGKSSAHAGFSIGVFGDVYGLFGWVVSASPWKRNLQETMVLQHPSNPWSLFLHNKWIMPLSLWVFGIPWLLTPRLMWVNNL